MKDASESMAGSRAVYDETIFENPEIIAGQRVILHEERPYIDRRNVRGRIAVITRRAVTVRRTIEVDVVHEELNVVYEDGDGTEMVGVQPESFAITLHAEEIEIGKRVRVVEEILISKKPVIDQRRLTYELRHERLDMLDSNDS